MNLVRESGQIGQRSEMHPNQWHGKNGETVECLGGSGDLRMQ